MIFALILFQILLAASAHMLIRIGALQLSTEQFSWLILLAPFRNLELFSGLALLGISFVLYTYILSTVRLNILYPVTTGSTIVVVTTGSVFILNESVNLWQITGIAAVVLGIALIAPEAKSGGESV